MAMFETTFEKSRALRDHVPTRGALPSPDFPDLEPDNGAETTRPTTPHGATAPLWLGLPELWLDPSYLRHRRVVTSASDRAAHPFEVLRTRLVQQARAKGWRRIAVVSLTSGAGKTTVLANLAFALGRLSDTRCMALDLDLRRPALARVLGLHLHHNMGDLIHGATPPQHVLRRHGANLAFGMNDAGIAQSAELLQGAPTARMLDRLQSDFAPDVMLIDLPAFDLGDDAQGFLHHVDAALIVIAAGRSTIAQIDLFERQIAALTPVAGMVLNQCVLPDNPFASPHAA